jgi:hypothetical protein
MEIGNGSDRIFQEISLRKQMTEMVQLSFFDMLILKLETGVVRTSQPVPLTLKLN